MTAQPAARLTCDQSAVSGDLGAARGCIRSRKQANRRFTREAMDGWLRERGVMLSGGDLDESPMAYRRLPEVLAQHAGTVRVQHTLHPFAVAMAGEGEFDPFRD